MCGIAGSFALDPDLPADREALARMLRPLAHRGPDDSGSHCVGGVALGYTRLAILDLAGGNQPHFNEDASLVSVCNGEIYNYPQLRRELEAKGHVLRSTCDVEVLVHLYEEHGADFVKRLNGQFALALYDGHRRELILARDPVGIAPLFYTVAGRTLLFGSEIKALLAHPGVQRRVNLAALDQILTFPGQVSPTTMFEGIHSLPPGQFLRARGGDFSLHEYWDLVYPRIGELSEEHPEAYHVERLEAALAQAVEDRLRADVPVGFYLSGGLDSSLIAALVQAARPGQRFHSFSITFPRTEMDEGRYQRLMAERVQSIHHEVAFNPAEIASRLRAAVVCAEAPLKESYNTCSLALSERVHQAGLKVVLTGEGADELFAGYVGYRFDGAHIPRGSGGFDLETLLEDEVRERLWGDPEFFYERNYHGYRETKRALYASALAGCQADFDAARAPLVDRDKLRGRHPLHQRSYVDFKLRLADHLLADHGDRVAYAHSVEARFPFLDLNVIEVARTLPPGLLVKDAVEKYPVRALAAKHLPAEIVNREKFGFVAPGTPSLLAQPADWVEDLLSPETLRRQGYFDPASIQRLRSANGRPGANLNPTFDTDALMVVLTFGLFLEAFGMSDL